MLLGFETDNLQDAGAGDIRHDIGHTLPHAQQSAAQHVVLPEAHALQTLLALLDFFTLPGPEGKNKILDYFPRCDQKSTGDLIAGHESAHAHSD